MAMSELLLPEHKLPHATRASGRSVVLCVSGSSAAQLSAHLDIKGLRAVICGHADLIDHALSERGREALILDLAPLQQASFERLRRIRERTSAIIVTLIPTSDSLARIAALEAGADACFSRPLEPGEIVAAVRSLLRRDGLVRMAQARTPAESARRVRFGRMVLEIDASRLISANGAKVPVTALELQVLKTFAAHPNKALTRDDLAELAHGRRWSPLDRSLDIRISRIRAKIEDNPDDPRIIVTVRGIGYRFDADAQLTARCANGITMP
jgi:two-component system phosphate regulon response regulator OmpR